MSSISRKGNAKQTLSQADLPANSQYLLEKEFVLLAGSKEWGRGISKMSALDSRAGNLAFLRKFATARIYSVTISRNVCKTSFSSSRFANTLPISA